MDALARSTRNLLTALPIDRSASFRDAAGEGAHAEEWPAALWIWLNARGQVLIDVATQSLDGRAASASQPGAAVIHLGRHQDRLVMAQELEADAAEALQQARPGTRWVDLRMAALGLPSVQAGLAAYARALCYWHSRHRYCGACGATTRVLQGGHRLRCTRAECGLEHFPRIDPAIIVRVEYEGQILLGRQPGWPPRRYSVLAGFVEPGESLEDALRREVHEESGILVDACEYHSSQPWPFPSSLMLGYSARTSDPTLKLGEELEDARWFTPESLLAAVLAGEIVVPPILSLSAQLIHDWYQQRTGADFGVDSAAATRHWAR